MMEWQDKAIVLGARPHGEGHALVTLLTRDNGLWTALVRGGASRRLAPVLQPGTAVAARWRARLSDQLGHFTLEPVKEHAATLLRDPDALAGLTAACAVAAGALAEREAVPDIHEGLTILLETLGTPDVWPPVLVRWELGVLESLGFGLDLGRCAVTGTRDDLSHVSPRTGRAVCRTAAAPYEDRLLILPPFLLSRQMRADASDWLQGMALTGFFLERHVFAARNRPLPEARLRLVDRLARHGEPSEQGVEVGYR